MAIILCCYENPEWIQIDKCENQNFKDQAKPNENYISDWSIKPSQNDKSNT